MNHINAEVVEALNECKKEGVEIRGTILAKSKQVENSYEVYRKSVEGSQLSMMAESDALYQALYHSSATFTGGNKFVTSIETTSSGSGAGDVFSQLQSVDVWLAMQMYNSDLIE